MYSMNETQWVTAVLTGGAIVKGNSMFYVFAKEGTSEVAVKRNLDHTIH